MAARLEVDGLRRLRRDLRRLGDDLSDLTDANALVAAIVTAEAAARAPKRTGRLAATVRGNRAKTRASVRVGYARVPYAGPIHWGWPRRGIEAQPFVSQAAQATEHVWGPAYARAIDQAAAKIAGRIY